MDLEDLLSFVDEYIYSTTDKRLKDIEVLILRGSWQGQNYEEIAETHGYTDKYLRQDVGPKLWKLLSETFGEKVSKTNFRSALERHYRSGALGAQQSRPTLSPGSQQSAPHPSNLDRVPQEGSLEVPEVASSENQGINLYRDWDEAVDVPIFYGRHEEIATLSQWTVADRCRTVLLLGMGGIGKTSLSTKLAQQIQNEFEYIIWRSLKNAPPIKELLTELVNFLSAQQEVLLLEALEPQISRVLHYLQQQRCLIVLDNVESILQEGVHAGGYLPGYEGYGYLFEQIGRGQHQSCLLLTSREKPKEIALLERDLSEVRSLHLKGLSRLEGQEFLKSKGCHSATEQELQEISEHYDGNPLALKIVASAVQELADGDMSEVLPTLRRGRFQFDDINDILKRQWERLSKAEQQVMYWLAVNREPVSLSELQADVVSDSVSQQLLSTVQSLGRRSLIERGGKYWALQPVVMEYVTCRLIEEASAEIETQRYDLLREYALLKAQSKDYVRQAQARFIIRLILDRLSTTVGSPKKIEQCLKALLAKLREETPGQSGYVGGNILNLLCELKSDLSYLDCSHIAIWQAYLVGQELHSVNFAHADLSRSVFTDTLSATVTVAFSNSGELLASGGTDGEIHLWCVADGTKLLRFKGSRTWIWSICFSLDDRMLISGSSDCTIKLWSTETGKCLQTLEGHTGWVSSVCLSPDGSTLASSSSDRTIKLWNTETGKCLQTFQGHDDGIWSVCFSPDGKTLASASDDRTIRLWEVRTGNCLQILQGHDSYVYSSTFSSDGCMLASGSGDRTVRLWEVKTGNCLQTFQGHTASVLKVAFNSMDEFLASSSRDGTIRLWSIPSECCIKTLQGHTDRVFSIAFSPNGQTVASGSDDKTIRLWNPQTGECLKVFQGYAGGILSLSFSSDNQTLAAGSEDKSVYLWDISKKVCFRALRDHTHWVTSVAFSPDGQLLTSGSHTVIRVWDIGTGECLRALRGNKQYIQSIAFSSDNRTIASGGGEQILRTWDVNTGECINSLEGHTNRVWSVAFSPNGQTLASGSHDTTIKLWDVKTGQCLKTLRGHENIVFAVAFSLDGQILASCGEDKTIRLWDVQTGKCFRILQGDSSMILSVAFSPDTKILACGSNDSTVKIWSMTTGQYIKTLEGHEKTVWSVAFSTDGNILTSGSQDETIKLWNTQTYDCIGTLRNAKPYEGLNITRAVGLTEAQLETLQFLGAVSLE